MIRSGATQITPRDDMSDLVQLELIRESLIAVVNEMRANIIHSSYAAIIYEGHIIHCGDWPRSYRSL